jgi:hypothetical protein
MPKNSEVDDRLNSLFAGLHPEDHASNPARYAGVERHTTPIRKNPGLAATRGTTRPIFLITIMGIAALSLLSAFIVLVRMDIISLPGSANQLGTGLGGNGLTAARSSEIPDKQPPSEPGGFKVIAVDPTTIKLSWSASRDDSGVVGYTIYRNGSSLSNISGSILEFTDTSVSPDTSYDYAVDAYDMAGNHSPVSGPLHVNTPALPGNLTYFLPTADTYVNADNPDAVYGSIPSLRVDAAPDIHSYLRFEVKDLGGKKINRARLLLYTNTETTLGIRAMAVDDNTWDEATTNYKNAPALGRQLALSVAADTASWVSLDVTAYITGEGVYNFAIVANSMTAMRLDSRETGTNSPKLVLDLR